MKRDKISPLVWSGAVLPDGHQGDLAVDERGRIANVSEFDRAALFPTDNCVDMRGYVLVPRLVEAHVHLDKTLLSGPWHPHREGRTIDERIAAERELLGRPDVLPLEVRASALLERLVANGVTAVRSHVDVSSRLGLSNVERLLELRERWSDSMSIQLVAFPQEGLARSPGTGALLAEALRSGCEVVGGIDPEEFDRDRAGQLNFVTALAAEHASRVDIHLHERGEVGAATIEFLASLVAAADLGNKVAISHAFCLGDLFERSPHRFAEVADTLAETGISVVTSVPGGDVRRPPITPLRARGVQVVVASDNVRDAWSPFGKADPLERACLAAYLEGWLNDDDLAGAVTLVSANGAQLLGLPAPSMSPGATADFVFVPAATLAEAIVTQPADRIALREGRIVRGSEFLSDRTTHSFDAELPKRT